jgi:hypothetical protein
LSDFASFGLIEYLTQRPTDLLNGMALLFALISVAPVSRRLGVGYGLFVLINVMLPAVSGGLVSIGRYSSVLFPAFFWLAAAVPTPLRPAVVAFFALGEGLAAVFFFTWREVY